jgi:hypothetical protein
MRVLILSTTMADGRLVKAGTQQEISDADAEILIEVGKARVVTQAKPEVVQPQKRRGRKRGAQ